MRRLLFAAVACALLWPSLGVAQEADSPTWSFEGLLPMITQVRGQLPSDYYKDAGRVLNAAEIAATVAINMGDRLVMIRDGKVVGEGTVREVVAQRRQDALQNRTLFLRPGDLPEGIDVPDFPRGPEAVEDASYDLFVVTDRPVEVLAPDPKFTDISWGAHDYCVRVGQQRFAIIRERWPVTGGFRGWQVILLRQHDTLKAHTDYTWTPK
jgi:hypothetical protein